MMRPRLSLHAVLELAALAALVAAAWWLGARATEAWLQRVAELAVTAPEADTVRSQARRAALLYSLGVAAIAAARFVGYQRSRDPIAAFWLLPAALGAALLGLVIQLATVEVARGVAAMPTGVAFAQGVLLGCLAGAAVLLVPRDPGELAARAQTPIAIAIVACFVALALVGSGPAGTGTRINLGPIQPLEIVKPMAVLFLAAFLGARASKLRWQRRRVLGLRWPRLELLLPAVGILLAIFAGLYVIGDLGPVLLLALGFLGMFYLASRATGWAVLALALVILAFALLAWKPELAGGGTVQTRLKMWRDPWTNAMSNGHQLGEGLWALAAGGQGLAYAATPIVPAGKTDLILATMTEQLGAGWLVGYQLLMASIVFGGLHVAARGRTAERTLIAAGAALLLLVQWIVIHAGTFGQLPLTGIVVPFLSSGKSSMVAFVAVVALIVRLSDSQPREVTSELAELHGAVRGFAILAALCLAYAVISGLYVTVIERHAISARTIRVRLADGTVVARQNPRLVALAAQIRRGSILDRDGRPLAVDGPQRRDYPLGSALGGLLGVHPTKVLLPTWAAERTFERRLRGYDDLAPFAPLLDLDRPARAAKLAELDAAVAARSVELTIDARLQSKVAALLGALAGKQLAAAAVVLDADTGHVLARAQLPDWDPNDPSWQPRVLAGDRAYLAKFHGTYGAWPDKTGLQGMFQSGSVGKIFTAVAAVRTGLSDRRYRCVDSDAQGPFFTRPGWTKPIHDHFNDRTHGAIDLVGAIAVSCNVYFGQLGLELGAEPLAQLRAAGVEAGFGATLAPGPAGSRQLASTAFGQGAMVMSPLQAARLVAAVANGGRYLECAPSMERAAPCDETRLVDAPAQLAPVVVGMRRVMTAGTGSALKAPAGVRAYGKTGTADVRGFVGEEPFGIRPGAEARPHSWFVAFAEPATAPENAPLVPGRLAVAVVVPRGGTGASAAGPLAMRILAAAKELGYLGGTAAP